MLPALAGDFNLHETTYPVLGNTGTPFVIMFVSPSTMLPDPDATIFPVFVVSIWFVFESGTCSVLEVSTALLATQLPIPP